MRFDKRQPRLWSSNVISGVPSFHYMFKATGRLVSALIESCSFSNVRHTEYQTSMQETRKQPDPPSRMCPVCGAGLRDDSAFCPTCGASLIGTTGRLQADRLLAGRYRIVRLLARGGMGAVYLAEDTRLAGAQVAVKEMASTFARGDTEAFARAVGEFEREAAM